MSDKQDLSRFVASRNFVAKLRVETGGRKGKTVTVIDGLPKSELFLKEMTKQLKQTCGAGGTYLMDKKDGVVEIQGDQLKNIRAYLTSQSIQFKG